MSDSDLPNDLDFDDLKREPVRVKHQGKILWLIPPTGDAVAKYKNAQMRAAKYEDGKPVKIDGAADADPLLVSLCLFYADAAGKLPLDQAGYPNRSMQVPTPVVRSWDWRVVRGCMKRLEELGDLKADETAEALDEQIAACQKRKAELEKTGGPAKNGPNGGSGTSESP